MSGALFHAGNRRPPRSRGRRIALGIAILLFAGALAPFLVAGAVEAWTGNHIGAALAFTISAGVLVLSAAAALAVVVRTLVGRRPE